MSKKSPFTGMKLTEQAGLDQRLFSSEPAAPSEEPQQTARPRNRETAQADRQLEGQAQTQPRDQNDGLPGGQEAARPNSQQAGHQPSQNEGSISHQKGGRPPRQTFDLEAFPFRKATFSLTDVEFEALEDLKLHLRRNHDLDVSKNDLIRVGLHLLLEAYEQNSQSSQVLRRLAGRTRR